MLGLLIRKQSGLGMNGGAMLVTLCLLVSVGAPLAWAGRRSTVDGFVSSMLLVSLCVGIFLARPASARVRATELELALPVSVRTWLAARMAALWIAFAVPIVIVTGVLSWGAGAGFRAPLTSGWNLLAAAALAVAVLHAVSPNDSCIESTWVFVGACTVGLAGFVVVTVVGHAAVGAVFAVVALGLVAVVLLRAPTCLRLVGSSRSTPGSAASDGAHPLWQPRSLHGWLLRSTGWTGIGVALWIPVFALQQDSLSVTMPIFALGVLWMMAFVGPTPALQVLRRVGHLPIRSATLAAYVVLPTLVWSLVGAGGASALRSTGFLSMSRYDRVSLERQWKDGDWTNVSVPAHMWRLHLRHEPVRVTGPSGESATLPSLTPVQALPLSVYNPYGVDKHSSSELLAWQLSRAVTDAYDVHLSPAWVQSRYLADVPCGSRREVRFNADFGARRVAPPAVGLFRALEIVLLWFVAAGVATRRNRPAGSPRQYVRDQLKMALLVVVTFVLMLGPLGAKLTGRLTNTSEVDGAVLGVLARWEAGSILVGTLLLLAVTTACFAVLARRFRRVEVPPPPANTWALFSSGRREGRRSSPRAPLFTSR
jgi:hypothetical protein